MKIAFAMFKYIFVIFGSLKVSQIENQIKFFISFIYIVN